MGWKNIYVDQESNLRIINNKLQIKSYDKKVEIPVDDISSVILANRKINLSVSVLSRLSSAKAGIVVMDSNCLPSGLLVPFESYSRPVEISKMQMEISSPARKQIWKRIIEQKIRNQNHHLKKLGIDSSLGKISENVKSGDSDFREAVAAKIYWNYLLETSRTSACLKNSVLNFGYAIVRSHLARIICASGLIAHMGIHHHGPTNNFNLADDLIEPYRPLIDHFCLSLITREQPEILTPQLKPKICEVLSSRCTIKQEEYNLQAACEKTTLSFIKSLRLKNAANLHLPGFLDG